MDGSNSQALLVGAAAACAALTLLVRARRTKKLPPPNTPQPELSADVATIRRLLEVIEHEILRVLFSLLLFYASQALVRRVLKRRGVSLSNLMPCCPCTVW